jgi:hypothetical protein
MQVRIGMVEQEKAEQGNGVEIPPHPLSKLRSDHSIRPDAVTWMIHIGISRKATGKCLRAARTPDSNTGIAIQ